MNTSGDHDWVFKFIVIGDTLVGKTCLSRQFTEQTFAGDGPEFRSTVGAEFGSRVIDCDDQRIKLQIWDTAGQERFRAVTRSFYRASAGVLMVYDITRRETYNNLQNWLDHTKLLTNPETVVFLIGNKCDLEDQRDVTGEEARDFAVANQLIFVETSAKTGANVQEAFVNAAKQIFRRIQDGSVDPGRAESGVKNVTKDKTTKTTVTLSTAESGRKGCCR